MWVFTLYLQFIAVTFGPYVEFETCEVIRMKFERSVNGLDHPTEPQYVDVACRKQ